MTDYDVEDDDEFDELFNYDIDKIKTTFDTNITTDDQEGATSTTAATKKSKGKGASEDLGVDEEIKIRTRKPTVKLTEELLLGPKGIPYLQEHAAKKIKFKGKGHEISDLERLLKFYQLWADNLYPKAQFKDAIDMIEKLGSSRGMQRRREEWIEEFKTARANEDDRLVGKARAVLEAESPGIDSKGRIVLVIPDPSSQPEGSRTENSPGGESGMEVPTSGPENNQADTAKKDNGDSLFFEDDDDDLDELDEILKQVESSRPANSSGIDNPADDELDELDAIMKDMEETPGPSRNAGAGSRTRKVVESDDEFNDAIAAMREAES